MKMIISVGRCLKTKQRPCFLYSLVWVKEYININLATCKNLCNLQGLYTAFKEKHPNVNIRFSKIFALRPKWYVLTGTKMAYSVWGCSAHQNVILQWTGTWHTKTWSKRSFSTLRATNALCFHVNPVLALQLWKNFLIRNSTNMKMIRNLITVSGTLRIEQYWQHLQPLTKNTKRLWLMLLMI